MQSPVISALGSYQGGIVSLPERPEKDKLQEEYVNVIEEYKATMHPLYITCQWSRNQWFWYAIWKNQHDVNALEEQKSELNEHYRRLKKLNYNLQLAEDPHFYMVLPTLLRTIT